MGRTLNCCLLASCSALMPGPGIAQKSGPADPRENYDAQAPPWLSAVGALEVPGHVFRDGAQRHLREECSATLVTRAPGRPADTLITAWHCLENYRDLSRPILFTLPGDERSALLREAYPLADGGGMHADWAVLRLRVPVAAAEAAALSIHPGRAQPGMPISMAGYSRDRAPGEQRRQLSFDPACQITAQAATTTDSDCRASRGASGGAVVQLSATGTAQLSGVVSEGDGAGFSTFVPVQVFRTAITVQLGGDQARSSRAH